MNPSHAPLRLFVALWPDHAVRSRCALAGQAMHRRCGGRLMPAAGLHITLAFLGEVSAERLPALMAALACMPVLRGELCLDRFGFWEPGIAWLEPSEQNEMLHEWVATLRMALTHAGFVYDKKPFKPHLTLLRKAKRPASWPALKPMLWRYAGACLVLSERDAEGATYRICQHFSLPAVASG